MAIDLWLPTFAVWLHSHKHSERESRRNVQPETAVNLIHPRGVAYWHTCGHLRWLLCACSGCGQRLLQWLAGAAVEPCLPVLAVDQSQW